MRRDSSSDVAASESDEDPSVTAVADEPAITRERAPEVQPGDLLAGRYQVEAIIGKGGSGVVVRAFDRVSATVVAVKILKPGLTHDPRWERRFQRELRLGRPIRHPNVCRIFDIGDADGYRFLTMEYATSGTLRDLVKKNQPLRPLPERLADAAGVIAGLAAIHAAGIVHRDVKPDNVLRMEDGRLVLSDFGLATDLPDSTMVSVFVGTPHYMAPEVREGDPATTRSDVWSLGVVLHEIFFGKRPEKRTTRSVSGVSKSSTVSASSTIERAMLTLCMRCLADDPADRPENADTVERIFEKVCASPKSVLQSQRSRTSRAAVAAGATIALFVIAGVVAKNRRSLVASLPVSDGVPTVIPSGEATDWSKQTTPVVTIPEHVHCFSMVDGKRVRVVWGTPRQADDIDSDTGARVPAKLRPETFANGCPEFSGDGNRGLFTTNNAAGVAEIMMFDLREKFAPRAVTPGSDPLWLRNSEEFLYNLDSSHAAVFSLATMTLSLLPDSKLRGRPIIVDKAVSKNVDRIALLVTNEKAEWFVSVYDGTAFERQRAFMVSAARKITFDTRNDDLWISYQLSTAISGLVRFEWSSGTFRNVGRYPRVDLITMLEASGGPLLLGREIAQDAWLFEAGKKTKLTADGENLSAALGPHGDLLLGKRTDDGTYAIWRQNSDGRSTRLTPGPSDVAPDVSPDGQRWVYSDYLNKAIMLCSTTDDKCQPLRRDEALPTWPRFSPDGQKLAYVTQIGTPRLTVVAARDGRALQLGPAHGECPPIWSSADLVWAVEGSPNRFFWSERKASTGEHTGRRLALGDVTVLDESRCWPSNQETNSAFFQRIRIQTAETSRVLRLPDSLEPGR